jgi:hypothetical protein
VLLFATRRSQYAIDAGRGLFMQLPGGTECGLRQGVWHQVVWDRQPKPGEVFLCSVAPRDGGAPVALRTGPVTWVGPEPPVAALAEIYAAVAAAEGE